MILLIKMILLTTNLCAFDMEKERLLNFANELRKDREYYRAITEYRRFITYYPDDPRIGQIHLKIARCFLDGKKYFESIEWCKQTKEKYTASKIFSEADLIMGRGYILLENYRDALSTLRKITERKNIDSIFTDEAHFLLGISYVMEEKWKESFQEFSLVSPSSIFYERAQQYRHITLEGERLPRKNQTLAALFSIVPGVGYIYTGNKNTGVASFIVNSLFGYGTYNAFQKKEYGIGIVIGLFSLGWYTGNIYGGAISASHYNERIRKEFKEKFKE